MERNHQEREGHCIPGNREHSSQSTRLHDQWNAATIQRLHHGGRPHEMAVLRDESRNASLIDPWSSNSSVSTEFV